MSRSDWRRKSRPISFMWPSRDSSANSIREKRALCAVESCAICARATSAKSASLPSSLRQNRAAWFSPRSMRERSDSPYFAASSAVSFWMVDGVTSVCPPCGAAPARARNAANMIGILLDIGPPA